MLFILNACRMVHLTGQEVMGGGTYTPLLGLLQLLLGLHQGGQLLLHLGR